MMKKFLILLMIFFMPVTSEAAMLQKDTAVAIMDFGLLKKELDGNIQLQNISLATSDYIIERLSEIKYLRVKEKALLEEEFQEQNLKTVGLIDPDSAKKIGELLDIRYLIYGNVTDVSLGENLFGITVSSLTTNKIKVKIVLRLMDVETGRILVAVKGEGTSDSSRLDMADGLLVQIGSQKVPQVSIHNALKKAAFNATDILVTRLSGKSTIEELFRGR